MALQTKGFALSTLPTAPRIPGNVGLVDVKEIYDGVKRGLESFEAVRRAPAGMALADAQMAAETAQAPLATRMALAQTEGVEAQTPIRTALLAAEASPEMQEAKRQALLNRSTRAPSPATQLARNYADAQAAADDDPTNKQKLDLAEAYRLQLNKSGAISTADPQGATAARERMNAATNATTVYKTNVDNTTRANTAEAGNASREGIATADREQQAKLAAAENTMRADLAARGFNQSEINTRLQGQATIEAAKQKAITSTYEAKTLENTKLKEEVQILGLISKNAEKYKQSFFGSGPVVGSGPALWARGLFGDTAGRELAASTALAMRTAVDSLRGLGAMSNIEYAAVIDQLPKTTDLPEAIDTKMSFLNSIRPWLLARSDLFLQELGKGTPLIQAHELVSQIYLMPSVPGSTPPPAPAPAAGAPSPTVQAPQSTVAAPASQVTPEQKAAAQAWLDANPNDPRAPAVRAKAGL